MERRRSHEPRTRVDLGTDFVVKESEHRADLELAKAGALADVARRHAFIAPAPVEHDLDAGTVTYERIEVGVPLGTLVPTGSEQPVPATLAAFARAGAALAAIHLHLHLDAGPARPLPEPVALHLPPSARRSLLEDAALRPVVSHGDYSVWNVFERGAGSDATTVVLDCCPNGYSSFEAVAHESRYLDLALFDSCLYGRAGWRDHLRLRSRPLGALRTAFIEGYERAGGATVDRALLRAASRAVLAAYLEDRRGWAPSVAALAGRTITLRQWRQ